MRLQMESISAVNHTHTDHVAGKYVDDLFAACFRQPKTHDPTWKVQTGALCLVINA
jgi:hypothetical protein